MGGNEFSFFADCTEGQRTVEKYSVEIGSICVGSKYVLGASFISFGEQLRQMSADIC